MKQAKVKARACVQAASPQPASLLRWYDKHRRILPWRALPRQLVDPYRVWLSEVMLQQTTVATVGPYFQKFITRWPRLSDLAKASLDDVMRMWAGLGYYRRARMLHQCAQKLYAEFGGTFPQDEEVLLELPGFGAYTAAAVRAIAFDKAANVVDGNVERVMARIFAVTEPLPKSKKKLRDFAARLVPAKRCGDYAQALMDLGATICTPRSPKCDLCPWQLSCRAFAKNIQNTLPVRAKKKQKPVRCAMAFVAFNKDGAVFLRRRSSAGLLGDMMEVPSSPWVDHASMPTLADAIKHAPFNAEWHMCNGEVIHVFTHFTLRVRVAVGHVKKSVKTHWVLPKDLRHEALPSVMKKIIHHAIKAL